MLVTVKNNDSSNNKIKNVSVSGFVFPSILQIRKQNPNLASMKERVELHSYDQGTILQNLGRCSLDVFRCNYTEFILVQE